MLRAFLFAILFIKSMSFAGQYGCLLDEHLKENGFSKNIEGYVGKFGNKYEQVIVPMLQNNPQILRICEIGFNAGHSSAIFLENTDVDTKVYSFDIWRWKYGQTGKDFIDQAFPSRHHLVMGNSMYAIPRFYYANPNLKFDLVFIDGGHEYEVAKADIINMKKLSHADTIVLIDDLQMPSVLRAYNECIKKGIIVEKQVHTLDQPKIGSQIKMGICQYIF